MNHLKKLRLEKGLTQLSLQMQTGIEQSLISKYESGERVPPTETLMLLADFFHTSMDYIMCLHSYNDTSYDCQMRVFKGSALLLFRTPHLIYLCFVVLALHFPLSITNKLSASPGLN